MEISAPRTPAFMPIACAANMATDHHFSRTNPQWQTFSPANRSWSPSLAMLMSRLFRWYLRKSTVVNVPTWNYTAVHAYAKPRVVEGRQSEAIYATVRPPQSKPHEYWSSRGRCNPRKNMPVCIGVVWLFETTITRVEGKYKLSQNRSETDQRDKSCRHLSQSSDSLAIERQPDARIQQAEKKPG